MRAKKGAVLICLALGGVCAWGASPRGQGGPRQADPLGARVQTDTLQKYIDHALHLGISSPAP